MSKVVHAILKINEEGNGVVESVTTNVKTNNVSSLPYTTDITNFFKYQTNANRYDKGFNAHLLGEGLSYYGTEKYGVREGNTSNYNSNYKGLVFGIPELINGEYIFNLEITIVGTDILAFNIWFDNFFGQYPLSYTVYSSITGITQTFTSTDNIIEISDLYSGYGTTIITINKWNNAKPIAIKYIENVEIDVDLKKREILDFSSQNQLMSNAEDVRCGLLSNTGSITIKDNDNINLLDKSKRGYLNMNMFTLDFYTGKQYLYASHISNASPYYTNNRTLQLQLTNDIENWNNIIVSEKIYNNSLSLLDLLIDILETYTSYDSGDIRDWLLNESFDGDDDLATYMDHITIAPFTLEEGTLLAQMNKICNVAQMNGCYLEDFRFYSARPLIDYITYTHIPPNKQYSTFEYSILTTNRYDGVQIGDTFEGSGNRKNIAKIETNEIMENATLIGAGNIKDVITQNILDDYENGIRSCKITIIADDYYSENNVKTVDYSNSGAIMSLGMTLRIEQINKETKEIESVLVDKNGNDVLWQVIGSTLRYEGQYLVDLELRELKRRS